VSAKLASLADKRLRETDCSTDSRGRGESLQLEDCMRSSGTFSVFSGDAKVLEDDSDGEEDDEEGEREEVGKEEVVEEEDGGPLVVPIERV